MIFSASAIVTVLNSDTNEITGFIGTKISVIAITEREMTSCIFSIFLMKKSLITFTFRDDELDPGL